MTKLVNYCDERGRALTIVLTKQWHSALGNNCYSLLFLWRPNVILHCFYFQKGEFNQLN